ncbi:MAG TPA: hypothetical protein DCQ36_06440 [Actinobacteria bacterium]|jgi:hypothetical protein|nr:hypothetical protein [Actinomycetota bacterium]
MKVRIWSGLALTVITVPVLALGLIDPMEGGVALLVAGAFLLVTWLVSRVPVPRLEWIAWCATMTVAAIAVAAGSIMWIQGITGPGRGLPWWLIVLMVAYEVGVVITIAGHGFFIARHIGRLRNPAEQVAGTLPG